MLLSYKKDNHLYLVFQDFEDKIDEIYKEIKQFPNKSSIEIKKLLQENFFSDTLQRQTHYVNSISTYIDDITDDNKQYFFHLYILPKDIIIDHNITDKYELITKIELLSLKLFQLYSQLHINNRNIKLFEQFKGSSFLQLEASYYISKLEMLYNYLLNYKTHSINKIICSDKHIGIGINELNMLEGNPLKYYQFIKVAYQKDLIRFIYTTISFLKRYRIEIFRNINNKEYKLLIQIINKINNLLLKISSRKNIIDDKISKENIFKYLSQYKNKKELKQNKKIYDTIISIFYTQLNKNVQFFISLDLTKIFETLIEKRLQQYSENLFIGNEDTREILTSNKIKDKYLNEINFLLKNPIKLRQYPDFLIKRNINDIDVYHIIDAKYKLENNVINEQDVRQILIYALLFNKKYLNKINNQHNIKKIIIYPDYSIIHLDNIDNLVLNLQDIDLFTINSNYHIYNDNVFDTEIIFIPIKVYRIAI